MFWFDLICIFCLSMHLCDSTRRRRLSLSLSTFSKTLNAISNFDLTLMHHVFARRGVQRGDGRDDARRHSCIRGGEQAH